jgi:hypothetical protein
MQCFVSDPFAKMLRRSRDDVFREGMQYTALNDTDEAILNNHFHRDVFEEPKRTEMQPTRGQSSECQMEDQLDDDSPLDPLKAKPKQSHE